MLEHDTDPVADATIEVDDTDQPGPRNRRSFLTAAAAALGAVAAQAAVSVVPAAAATGSTMKAGQTNTATATTTVKNTASGGTGLRGTGKAIGVRGTASATGGTGVRGEGTGASSYGVFGSGTLGVGGIGTTGVAGYANLSGTTGVYGGGPNGVVGETIGPFGAGVTGRGTGTSGTGVFGTATAGGVTNGVYGKGTYGVVGVANSTNDYGVHGSGSASGTIGVYGSGRKHGVQGQASGSGAEVGVYGTGPVGVSGSGPVGVAGASTSNIAVYGHSTGAAGYGLYGDAPASGGTGVYGSGGSYGVRARGSTALFAETTSTYAASFVGTVSVAGEFYADDKYFRIDHPLDPANRYLVHSCVEAPERLNVYSGTVTLDGKGRATVKLPQYHDALNGDHRYQLTAIGGAAPDLHVAAVISKGRFKIAGGTAGLTVCWMVTGVRQDAWAAKHKLKVQPLKSKQDRGRYLNPEVFGKPKSARIGHLAAPKVPKAVKRLRKADKPSRPKTPRAPRLAATHARLLPSTPDE